MALATERQAQLTPLLDKLREIDGVLSVESDDWNSYAIDVFVTLKPQSFAHQGRLGPYSFDKPIRSIKAAIKRALKGTDFHFLDQPEKKREYNGKDYYGKTIWHDLGYDKDYIKLEVLV